MGRWQSGARDRLERAALELFAEHGFAETTVPQITARAGLTTRTFFRHFADKREVLFAGEDGIPAVVAGFVADAPPALAPMEVVVHGLRTVMTPLFEDRLDYLRMRRAVMAEDEGLHERELRKLAHLSEVIGRELRRRGADDLTAALAAALAVTVFNVSLTRWLEADGEPALAAVVDETLAVLHSVAGDH
ncbi:TetR/AcrR family transcriptional regulator [Pseudonocardia sp. 73-21]|uniref:TetR/AcrR family transcriptional regulator n=1 Tax=Pseudonocardia sp. 73-21 TaxID=1895809 RepID=UPI00095EE050|nr:TetR/AcrR family transcriptional regulator [Pseudonocardia sp. 73-21]OJY37782.1 MAG: TetR family transcriptional regulator [Pseudonocardia sp. 73-21]